MYKILILTGYFYPSQNGGPSNSTYWLSKALYQNNVNITVLSLRNDINDRNIIYDKMLDTNYGKVIYINNYFNFLSFKYLIYGFKIIKNYDIIQVNSFFSFNSFVLTIYALLNNKNVLWSPRGEFFSSALSYKSNLKKLMISIINLLQKNINFHVTSQEEENTVKLVIKNIKNIYVIPNFIDIPPQKSFIKKNQILFIGRIHPIKAIENLILACNQSYNFKNLNFKLLIVGDYNNKYGKILQKLAYNSSISDNIVFINKIDDLISKNQIYTDSICTILPSHSENFGNVVVESLSNSTFVIASKGTPWQILEENNAGYWIKNDVNTLSEIIDKVLLKNVNEITMLSNNAYNLAYNNFSINNNFSIWTNCYKKILNNN